MAINRLAVVGFLAAAFIFVGHGFIVVEKSPSVAQPGGQVLESPLSSQDKALADLGHWLFFDNRISKNQTKSCASCHAPERSFTDGYRSSVGSTGESVAHNAPSLLNVVFRTPLGWQSPGVKTLSQQLRNPIFNQHPPELGWLDESDTLPERLARVAFYKERFAAIFGPDRPTQWKNIFAALVAYESQLVSFQSGYDKYLRKKTSLNEDAVRGKSLFYSKKLACGQCHVWAPQKLSLVAFQPPSFLMPPGTDSFRVPDLRNVAITAPYGQAGDWPDLSSLLRAKGYTLTAVEQKNLVAFLNSFTDTSYFKNPYFNNPYSSE